MVAACGGKVMPMADPSPAQDSGVGGAAAELAQSCDALATLCQGESCCATVAVPGGTFLMGRSADGGDACPGGGSYCWDDEQPEHLATVSAYGLDKYEVTVGRFRRFVEAYESGWRPSAGAGAHPHIAGSGWDTTWDSSLPADATTFKDTSHLNCNAPYQTWTDTSAANEDKAINCVNWYEAFAFCIWDGGRLPTEAEWEFAAAGGDLNLLYPWGSAAPDCTYANYYTGSTYCTGLGGGVLDVGSMQKGNGRWDHADLAGNAGEWVFDWFGAYDAAQNNNYANTTTATNRVTRGGSWGIDAYTLRSAYRNYWTPISHSADLGFRCARTP
jgi:formylglycine-generating enzyme required for sulfatase activity